MSGEELRALALRVEALQGPCREVDGVIAEATAFGGNQWKNEGGGWISCFGHGCQVAQFTQSLDAALSLVPDGWDVVEADSNGGLWLVRLGYGDQGHPSYREVQSWPEGRTGVTHRLPAPLAFTTAALRARATAADADGGK